MLRDKYTWVVPKNCCGEVRGSIHYRIGQNKTKLYALCILNLERLSLRLLEAQGKFGGKPSKIMVSKREALAFHISYTHGFIDPNDIFIKELFDSFCSRFKCFIPNEYC